MHKDDSTISASGEITKNKVRVVSLSCDTTTGPPLNIIKSQTVWEMACTRFRLQGFLIVLGFNDTSTLEGHFVSSPREREKRDRRESRGDEREGQGRKRNRNESEEQKK